MSTELVYRLRKRAEIRRRIPTRKSVQEGARDRLADLLEEAATELELQAAVRCELMAALARFVSTGQLALKEIDYECAERALARASA